MRVYIGIDVGASHIETGLFNENREILARVRDVFTPPITKDTLTSLIKNTVLACLTKVNLPSSSLCRVGIGLPGIVNAQTGALMQSYNLGIANYLIAGELSQHFEVPVFVGNDVNCAALAEYRLGHGQGVNNFVMLSIGTGLGGGIILNGKLLEGSRFGAGEIGHMVIMNNGHPCSCGRNGCFEAYASVAALTRQAKSAMLSDRTSLMWQVCNGSLENVNGKTPFEAQRLDDATAQSVIALYVSYLACGIGNIINMLEPDVICIGGAVSREGDFLLQPLQHALMQSMGSVREAPPHTRLLCAALGTSATLIGATFLGEDVL